MVIQQGIYYEDIDVSNELFLRADKFYEEKLIEEMASPITYLCTFSQDNQDFLKESLNVIQQKKVYEELYSAYKTALNKALKSKSNSQQLIDLLQEFVEKGEDSSKCSSEDKSDSNKENQEFVLLNPKKRCNRVWPSSTK
ncbi:1232_t:CDS:2 [Cetraspora pellucida]|uniref:1232_t:CDS:1 n=1 Tax=Cetraspora pellucida TaxID=1433469 RepID=A0ACA9MNS4_9GLOM|nr:1232_t:CDS:2 [Cetraspora pellucida]